MKTDNRIFGMSIRVDDKGLLPLQPTPREEAQRIVRNGLADVLRWLGEPVGPAVDAETHGVVFPDASGRPDDLMVSREFYEELLRSSRRTFEGFGRPDDLDVVEPIWRASVDCQRLHTESQVYVKPDSEVRRQKRLDWARDVLDKAVTNRHLAALPWNQFAYMSDDNGAITRDDYLWRLGFLAEAGYSASVNPKFPFTSTHP